MYSPSETQELKDRLNLIENMIAEGRRKTESWGWTFVLWGAAYIVAIVFANLGSPLQQWSTWGRQTLAWPVTMFCTLIVMYIILSIRGSRGKETAPDTTIGRAIFSVWIAMGIAMFLLLLATGSTGRIDQQSFVSIVSAMLGIAHFASAMILRWRTQFLTAFAWWIATVASCFVSNYQSMLVFLGAIFLAQIVFGSYMMLGEARERRIGSTKSGQAHA